MLRAGQFPPMLLLCLLLSGCQSAPATSSQPAAPSPQSSGEDSEFSHLSAHQATADAQQAVAAGNVRLLAFTNRTISFPGVDADTYSRNWIEKHCGIEYLAGTGDTLTMGEDTRRRRALKTYASTYNRLVLRACVALQPQM